MQTMGVKQKAIDPVCGMAVDPDTAPRLEYRGQTVYFCSEFCRKKFLSGPERYAALFRPEPAPPPREHVVIPIGGMKCPDCLQRIEGALRAEAGVGHAAVNLNTGVAVVDYDPARTGVARLLDAIRREGFAAGAARVRLAVTGMTCASCVTAVEGALARRPGVLSATVNPAEAVADVIYEPRVVDFEGLKRAIEASGYRAAEATPATEEGLDRQERERRREYRTLMRKFWFAAAVSLPVIAFSYPDLIPGLRDWMAPGSAARRVVWALLGLLTLPVLLWSGSQFFSGMWAALKHRSANMHTLIAISITAAYLYSVVAVAFPQLFPEMALAEVFWDVTAVVVALVVLGLALELKAKGRTSEAIRKLIGLQAKTARVMRDGRELDIPVEEVLVGDTVVVRPGEKVPVDGQVLEDRAPWTSR